MRSVGSGVWQRQGTEMLRPRPFQFWKGLGGLVFRNP